MSGFTVLVSHEGLWFHDCLGIITFGDSRLVGGCMSNFGPKFIKKNFPPES